jgi:uncharacterized protein (DUF433 family)
VSWNDHIVPAPDAGTRPVLKRTRHAVEEVLTLLGRGHTEAELGASYGLTSDEVRACFEYASTIVADRMMQRAPAGGAKLHVSRDQLKKASRRHAMAGADPTGTDDSRLLLLIYALECGLKSVLLRRRGFHTTSKLDEDDLTHDLDDLLKLVGEAPRFHSFKVEEPQESAAPKHLHEALRYGRRMTGDSRRKVVEAVHHVLGWLEENRE